MIKVLAEGVEALERELDATIRVAAHARSEKRQAETAQRLVESRTQEITKEIENTTKLRYKELEAVSAVLITIMVLSFAWMFGQTKSSGTELLCG